MVVFGLAAVLRRSPQKVTIEQSMLQMWNIGKIRKALGVDPKWTEIADEISLDRPELAEVAHDVAKFLAHPPS